MDKYTTGNAGEKGLTFRDIDHCRREWREICGEMEADGEVGSHEYDRIVMTSIGYVEVQWDGDVVAYGRIIFSFGGDE